MINVTKSFLPPMEEYTAYLSKIWDSNILTNRGPMVQELEAKLAERFHINNLLYVNNGTIALQLAVKLFNLKGEVITTPFSYVATTSALIWEGLTPIYVDINEEDFCIDPAKIEAKITDKTTAIMATHVFGNPCDVEAIEKIAKKHNLKVIYDAAHAFDISCNGKSILEYGDVSTLSFHATKVFHTVEGGAVVLKDSSLLETLKLLHSFGHKGDDHYICGINAKSSEFHAAMGLTNLPYVDRLIEERKRIAETYFELLPGDKVNFQKLRKDASRNYSYFPVMFENEKILLRVIEALHANQILPRRYFYPSLNTLKYVEKMDCPVSEDISTRILCLPLYPGLSIVSVRQISRIISDVIS